MPMGVAMTGRKCLKKMGCWKCFFFLWTMACVPGPFRSNAASILSIGTMGVNYGQVADNLPSPDEVVGLLHSNNIQTVKIYDVNQKVLKAFANSGIELIVGIGNEYVGNMTDPEKASEWVNENIQPYLPSTKISGITVGNEVYTGNDTQLMEELVPAMQNIHSALMSIGLGMDIEITTAHSLAVLGNSFPPSGGFFSPTLTGLMKPLLDFLSQIGAPFLINAYPYFAYKSNPDQVPLNYVLLEPNEGVIDPNTNLHYDNMLYAQIDAVYSALSALGYANLEIRVSETGWPSQGDPDEAGATLQNAQTYNGNLLQRLAQKQGTPLRSTLTLQAYIFALFNENMKPGPTSERNYGLFYPNGTPVYNVGLSGSLHTGSSSSLSFTSAAKGTHSVVSICIYIQISSLCYFLLVLPYRQ